MGNPIASLITSQKKEPGSKNPNGARSGTYINAGFVQLGGAALGVLLENPQIWLAGFEVDFVGANHANITSIAELTTQMQSADWQSSPPVYQILQSADNSLAYWTARNDTRNDYTTFGFTDPVTGLGGNMFIDENGSFMFNRLNSPLLPTTDNVFAQFFGDGEFNDFTGATGNNIHLNPVTNTLFMESAVTWGNFPGTKDLIRIRDQVTGNNMQIGGLSNGANEFGYVRFEQFLGAEPTIEFTDAGKILFYNNTTPRLSLTGTLVEVQGTFSSVDPAVPVNKFLVDTSTLNRIVDFITSDWVGAQPNYSLIDASDGSLFGVFATNDTVHRFGSLSFVGLANGNIYIRDSANVQVATGNSTTPPADNGALHQVFGNQSLGVVEANANTTMAANTIYVKTGAAAVTFTLPAVAGKSGWYYMVKNRGSVALTIAANGGANEIYDTAAVASKTVNPGEAFMFVADSTFWNL